MRAQRSADDARAQGVADTRADIERLREQAVAEIDAERLRALAEVRGQVADLALLAAGKVVGETMTGDRERRLVDEFLAQATVPGPVVRGQQLGPDRPCPPPAAPPADTPKRRVSIAERDDSLETWVDCPRDRHRSGWACRS